MPDFVRRLVSGDKARFKDEHLGIELDLAYITDNVIVMGYPATGVEGMYRNRREHALKFLQHHHGSNYWVFNFCPVNENSYPASVFDGRVSRYPFPDHHAPPLAILPLAAREMRAWLENSQDRVVVLHCKAGKGRSGTMACAYLLSLEETPGPPDPVRSNTERDQATVRAEELMNKMPADDLMDPDTLVGDEPHSDPIIREFQIVEDSVVTNSPQLSEDSATKDKLSHILDLHTRGRMRRSKSSEKHLKQGVSIPSQRRWLYYWSLLLAHQGPPGFWSLDPGVASPKVRLTGIKIRMRELSAVKAGLWRVANTIIDHTSLAKMPNLQSSQRKTCVWASIGRYDDDSVRNLEVWERRTRSEHGELGKQKLASEAEEGGSMPDQLFQDEKWDTGKMVKSFATLVANQDDPSPQSASEEGKTTTFTLCPLTTDRLESLREDIEAANTGGVAPGVLSPEAPPPDETQPVLGNDGIVVDVNREVRVKLYMGQVFMGWFWMIPSFHAPVGGQPPTLKLTRKELDFPLGIGANIIDLEVCFEWYNDLSVPK